MRLLLILASLAAASTLVESEEEVADLRGVQLSPWLKRQTVAVVFFYSPRNAQCRELLKVFDELAAGMRDNFPTIAIAKIDCTSSDSKKVCLPYVAKGYPTITVFNEGQPWSREENLENYDRDVQSDDLYLAAKMEREAAEAGEAEIPAFIAPFRKALTELHVLMEERVAEKEVFGSTGKEPFDEASAIVDATDVNLAKWLPSHPAALVMFYSPHNAESRKLLPVYNMFATSVKESNPDAVLAKVDCSESKAKKICDKHVKDGIPTFTIFKGGVVWQTDDKSDKSAIDEVWKDAFEDGTAELDTKLKGSPLRKALRDFIASLTEPLDDDETVKSSAVVDLRDVDFTAWLKSHPDVLIMFYSPRSFHCRKLMPFVHGVAGGTKEKYPGVVFAKVDCTVKGMKKVCDEYVNDGFPIFTVFKDGLPWQRANEEHRKPVIDGLWDQERMRDNSTYLANAEFTAPLRNALSRLLALQVVRQSVTEPEQVSDFAALPGVNFASWLNSHPVALVMFYSPNSAESRKLLPLFDTFAEDSKEGDAIVAVAKIDCTAADSQEICLTYVEEGFPAFAVFRDGRPWSIGQNPMDNMVADGILKSHLDDFPEHEAPFRKAIADLGFLLAQNKMDKVYGVGGKPPPMSVDDEAVLNGPSPVLDLTGVDFSAWLNIHPVALIMFYNPKRRNFRQALQYYETTSAFLKKIYPDTMFGKVECTAGTKRVCDQYVESGFPSFTVFKDGLVYQNEEDFDLSLVVVEDMFKNLEIDQGFSDTDTAEFIAPTRKAMVRLLVLHSEMQYGKEPRFGDEL